MSHWYSFHLTEKPLLVVCNADRKAEIEVELPFPVKFGGCVARDKIAGCREQPDMIVFNSVNRLKAALPYIQEALK